MATQFQFTVSTDVIAGKADAGRLDEEIRSSSITVALDGVSIAGDTLTIDFKADLSVGEETVLHGDTTGPAGGLVGNHSGEPLPDPATKDGIPVVHLDSPEEVDGKLLVTPTPSPGKGWKTYYTSRGDHGGNGRGKGTKLEVVLAGGDSALTDITFTEPVWLHDGEFTWDPSNFDPGDSFAVSIVIPATPTVSNPGAGNCNLFAVSGGNILIPANGDGAHDVDLATAIPVLSVTNTGYYEVDHMTGVVTPAPIPGTGNANLFDFQIEPFFVPGVSMGNPLGVFAVDAYQSEWISERWSIRLFVDKPSSGAGVASGWVMVYRRNTTTF